MAPNAIHAPRPFVRSARQKAHSISVSTNGTKTGSMPTRLKNTCQRMIASEAAARRGSAAGIRSSARASSRARA